MSHTTCTCRPRRSASRVVRVAVVSVRQVTVAAAAAAASWSPAARRRAAAGRPGRRPLVLLHCKPREASGAALLLANRNKAMRIAHYEVILTGIDAPRWSQRIATPSQLCPAQASALFSAQDYSWVESRGLVQGTGRAKLEEKQRQGGHNAGAQQSPAHLDGISCPATGGTSLGSPRPPFYLFVSLGGGEPNDDKIC